MKRFFQILTLVLLPAFAFGQVVKTAAVPYTKGAGYTPNINTSSEIRIDTATSVMYWWNRNALTWVRWPHGIDVITGGIAPAYTPQDNQALFAINADEELYYYDGAVWVQVGGTGFGGGENIYNTDDLLKAGGTTVGLDSGSLKLTMATTAASTKYGIEITASNATSANRFISMKTQGDSCRIQESGGDYSLIATTDFQFNISDQERHVADSVQFFEGTVQSLDSLPYILGLAAGGWTKRITASGNTGKALVSNGSKWIPTTVVTSADGNGIYTGSGNVPDGTVATLVDDFEFSGGDISSFTVTTGVTEGGKIQSTGNGLILTYRDTTFDSNLSFGGTGAAFNFNDGSTDRLTINGRDARYGNDYSATFSARSLIDRAFAEGLISAAVSLPEGEVAFGNATSNGIESSPDMTFFEGDNLYLIDAGVDVTDGSISVGGTSNPFVEITDRAASGAAAGGILYLRSLDGAANASGDRVGVVQFNGQTGIGGTAAGAVIESFAAGAWGVGDAPGKLVFSTTPDGTTTPANVFELAMTGAARLHNYGDGTFTGTATKTLQVDVNGNLIEGAVTAGGISLGAANQIFGMNAAGTANEYKTLSGTSNQITVTHGAGTVTLSTPQDIHASATPTFSDLTVTDDLFVTDDATFAGTSNVLTFNGSAGGTINMAAPTNLFYMSGASSSIVGDGSGNAQVQVSGLGGTLDAVMSSGGSYVLIQSLGASSATVSDAQPRARFFKNDGAALSDGHILGAVDFQSRGSTSAAETGAQIAAYADGADWTGASNPTKIEVAVVPSGSDVLDVAHTIRATGQHEFNNYGSLTFTGTPIGNAAFTSSGAIIERPLGADELNAPPTLRPAQLTAKTDNWNPTGFSTTKTQFIEVSGDASFRFITGMTAATRDGVLKTVENNGATNCVGIAKQHTDSDAENRFTSEIVLYPGMAATFKYDSVAARWDLTATNKDHVTFGNTIEYSQRDWGGVSGDDWFVDFNAFGGSYNKSGATSTTINVRRNRLVTGSVATSYPLLTSYTGQIYLTQNKTYVRQYARLRVEDLSTSAEDFDVRWGFQTSAAIDTVVREGAFISYERGENSGGWTIKTNDGSTTTTTNAGAAISADTWYSLELIYYPYGEVTAFIDGVRYTTTSTIPEAIGVILNLQIDKDNGTTSRELYYSAMEVQYTYVSDAN